MASADVEHPVPIVIGGTYFAGSTAGYLIKVLDVHEETSSVHVHYDGYNAKYDEWVPRDKIKVPTNKRDRSHRPVVGNEQEDLELQSGAARLLPPRPPLPVPGPNDAVEVFDNHMGWRRGTIEAREAGLYYLGSIVRFEDTVSPSAAVVHLPQDFAYGDLRWPRKQGAGDLEGRRVMVPSKVFGQSDRDGQCGYAGTVKCDTGRRASIYFFIDGKEIAFESEQVRGWLVGDRAVSTAWEEQAPYTMPAGWPGDVIFCSFPLQHGIHPTLLKRFCALSERMVGVEIRAVDQGHPLVGTQYNLGLYATRDFRRGATIGQYAGMIEISGRHRRWSQKSTGRFDMALDMADGLSSAQGLTLDAKLVGNEGRIINDFQGIAPESNVRFRTAAHPTKGLWVDIITTCAIARGEEILADYDYGMVRDDDKQPTTTKQSARRRAQPPEAAAERFELGSVRSGADGCSHWRVVGSYEGYKEGASSNKRKQGSFRQRWVLAQQEESIEMRRSIPHP